MVHAIQILKCKKGHVDFSLSFDSNHCGCHHNGDPCLIISCRTCVKESMENNTEFPKDISIPMKEEVMKELKEFSQLI